MERRKALKIAAGAMAAGGAGLVAMTTAFKTEVRAADNPKNIEFKESESDWKYVPLDPDMTAEIAYNEYPKGSCMYGVFSSIIKQLAEIVGEPFASFPTQMMKYGHGGVNGYGTICGTLNGSAAVIGLLVEDKSTRDALASELFRMYEETPLPVYKPQTPGLEFEPPVSVAKSVLCHASTTRWGKVADCTINSKERKERCRRLTADMAAQTVKVLNNYHDNVFMGSVHDNETVRTCTTCHGGDGKLANISGEMNCTSCHEKSLAHKIFADPHYKLMSKR